MARFEFNLSLTDTDNILETRKYFLLLINEALENTDKILYNKVSRYKNNNIEPYTFCISSDRNEEEESDLKNIFIKGIFSSFDCTIIVAVYNYLIKIQNQGKIKIVNLFLHPLRIIPQNRVVFKTLSPIILDANEKNWLVKDNGNDLLEKIKSSIKLYVASIGREELSIEHFSFIKVEKIAIKYDNNILYGISGIFEMCASVELLNLIYNVGVGIYRGEGFGMVELTKIY